jgi:tRNA U38,U39,U40 pseudouridine synthase TruA
VPTWKLLESVTVTEIEEGVSVEVRAPSFVWGMVRKIVGALREYDQGRLPLARIEAAIEGRERLTLPMAEPEGLVLWEVEYPIRWETQWAGPNRHQDEFVRKARRGQWVRNAVLDQLFGPVRAAAGGPLPPGRATDVSS